MSQTKTQFLSPGMYGRENILSVKLIREDKYSALLSIIQGYAQHTIPQCVYLEGQAGTGKTFLLMRLHCSLPGHLNVIYHDFMLDSPESMVKLCTMIESGAIPPRSVILADNFDRILDCTERYDHFHLRKLLSATDAPILIGAGRSVPKSLLRYDEAFFESFKILHLGEITIEQSMELASSVFPEAKKHANEIDNVLNIVGKTPLMASLAAHQLILGRQSSDEILTGILDGLTPYYENIILRLPPTARDIFLVLLLDGPCSLPEIRGHTHYTSGKISTYLHMLMDRNHVDKTTEKARMSRYFVCDKVMKNWAEKNLKNSRLEQSDSRKENR